MHVVIYVFESSSLRVFEEFESSESRLDSIRIQRKRFRSQNLVLYVDPPARRPSIEEPPGSTLRPLRIKARFLPWASQLTDRLNLQ